MHREQSGIFSVFSKDAGGKLLRGCSCAAEWMGSGSIFLQRYLQRAAGKRFTLLRIIRLLRFGFFMISCAGNTETDITKLQNAWNDPRIRTFDEISIPPHGELFPPAKTFLRKSGGGRDRIADFIESRAEGMSRQFISFCRAIKEATNDRVLAGGYRAEGAPVSYPFLVQQCSRRMYAAPEVDFFASCPGGRTPENPVMPSLLNGSLRLHNKLAVTELDFRTPWVGNWGRWGKPSITKRMMPQSSGRERCVRSCLQCFRRRLSCL